MKLYCGDDLHRNNGVYTIIDETDKIILRKRVENHLPTVRALLEPYKRDLVGIAVESTSNWYWLADGLRKAGYTVHLVNPSAVKKYEGLKHSCDESESFHLAHLLRLGILPTGYIYPKEERPVRDMLRRRILLVHQKTQHLLSYQSLCARQLGICVPSKEIKNSAVEAAAGTFDETHLVLMGETNLATMQFLSERIRKFEKAALKVARLKPQFAKLHTVSGIGDILALTIAYETGEISRFHGAGNYASYARAVSAEWTTNSKKKGEGNRKNGNRYLAWAFVEAALHCRRHCEPARRFYQRKLNSGNNALATKALACKLAKACFYVLRDQVDFDPLKAFS